MWVLALPFTCWMVLDHSFIHSSVILWTIYWVSGAMLDARATEMNRTVFLFLRNLLFRVLIQMHAPMHSEKCQGCFTKSVSRYSESPKGRSDTIGGAAGSLPGRRVIGLSFGGEKKKIPSGDYAMVRYLHFMPLCISRS